MRSLVSGIGFQPVASKMTGWKPIPLQSSHDLDSNRYSQGNDEPRKEKGGEHDGKEEAQKTLVRFAVADATI